MEITRPAFRQVLRSVLFTTGVGVLAVGVAAAFILSRRAITDPTAQVSLAAAVAEGMFVYGPTLLVNLWPVSVPVIVAGGVLLSVLHRRIAIPRWLETVIMVYGGSVALATLALVL